MAPRQRNTTPPMSKPISAADPTPLSVNAFLQRGGSLKSSSSDEKGDMSSAMSLETVTDRDFSMPSPTGSPTPLVNGERRSLGGQEEESEIEMDGLHINGNGSVERTSPLVIAHVEVRLKANSRVLPEYIRQLIDPWIRENFDRIAIDMELEGWDEVTALKQNAESVRVKECNTEDPFPLVSDLKFQVHVYLPSTQDMLDEFSAIAEDDEDAENDVMAATVRELPSKGLIGVWESLIYEDEIKPRLLNYIYTTLLFSDADVDFNIVTWNRVVLLHGPPGTGKTSLCRALAQKLAIRLSDRYHHGKLVEINSHSLFSKWFSESGKLVQKLFAKVTEMVEDESGFVVVLIDEVESLTAARAGALTGTEPSDALRVVNALLTQLDKLKNRKNVLIMSTSNLAQAIDSAFVDRADIKQYIGLPPPEAVYWILQGCLEELMKKRVIESMLLFDWRDCKEVMSEEVASTENWDQSQRRTAKACQRLYELAGMCQGMSGRTLRRLPVLAHARYIGYSTDVSAPVEEWIEAMYKVVQDEGKQMKKLEDLVGTGKV